MRNAVYRHPISIEPSDIDFMGHVNNATYLKWVQDAVIGHWHRIASVEMLDSLLWVALKHEICYHHPAFRDDSIIASVVLERVAGVRAFYETVIRRGEIALATIKSTWCCVDALTRRPARLTREIFELAMGGDL